MIPISVRNETVGAYLCVRPFYAASAERAHTQVRPYTGCRPNPIVSFLTANRMTCSLTQWAELQGKT